MQFERPDASRLQESNSASLKDGMRFLRRQVWRVLLSTVVMSCLAFLVAQNLDSRFVSTANLLIDTPQSTSTDNKSFTATEIATYFDTQRIVLQSFSLLSDLLEDPVIRDFPEVAGTVEPSLFERAMDAVKTAVYDLISASPDMTDGEGADPAAAAVGRIKDMISVEREGDSTVLSITVESSDAVFSAYLANTLFNTFLAHEAARLDYNRSSYESRLADLRETITAAESAVEKFRSQHGIILGESGTLSEQRLTELNTQLIRNRTELFEKEAMVTKLQDALSAGGDVSWLEEIFNSDLLVSLREDLGVARQRNETVSELFGESSPEVAQISALITELQTRAGAEVERLKKILQSDVDLARSRDAFLIKSIDGVSGEVASQSGQLKKLNELQRTVDIYTLLYQQLLERAEDAQTSTQIDQFSARLISPATVATSAFFPPNSMILALGMIFGAGLGLVWALVSETVRDGFRLSSRVEEALGLPVLAAVPNANGQVVRLALDGHGPSSPFSTIIDSLAASIPLWVAQDRAAVLLITSSLASEGKTTLVGSIGRAAAASGKRTLLVDADGNRHLSGLMGHKARPALPDGGQKKDGFDRLIDPIDARLFILQAGGNPASVTTEAGQEPSIAELLAWARLNFDLVVIDSPALGQTADALRLSELSDIVIFVLKWDSTPEDLARICLRRLPRSKARGILFNQVNVSKAAKYGDSFARLYRFGEAH